MELFHVDRIVNTFPIDDIWDQDSVYLEMLAREVCVVLSKVELCAF